MKQRTKENLINIFGSLFSNQKAINGAKHNPWWVAVIMFILAVMLPVVPITVGTSQTYGASFLSRTVNSWDTQITQASLDLYNDGVDFTFGENHSIKITKTPNLPDTEPIYQYINTAGTNEINFQVYYTERPVSSPDKDVKTVSNLLETLIAKRWEIGTSTEQGGVENNPSNKLETSEETSESTSEEVKNYYRPSFILIYPQGFYNYLAKSTSTESLSSGVGDWRGQPVGKNLLKDVVLNVEGADLSTASASDPDFTAAVFNNWKDVYNQGYIYTRNQATLTSSLIFLGVYAGLSFFMGLMIFLLTRGKNNPFKYLTFWACFKINAWASVSPAILALILGFMLPSYSMMFFIILHGLRTMWMTTKQLRPQY